MKKGTWATSFLHLAILGLAVFGSTSSAQKKKTGVRLANDETKHKQGTGMTRKSGVALTEQIRNARQNQIPQEIQGGFLGWTLDQIIHAYTGGLAAGEATGSDLNDKPMIISGTVVTDRTQAPFAARLHDRFELTYPNGTIEKFEAFSCTGSLVTTRRVLTAGHCLKPLEFLKDLLKNLTVLIVVDVYLGDLRVSQKNEFGEVMITARDWRIHPEYKQMFDFDFDVGLLFLNTAVSLSRQIQLISLPLSSTYTVGDAGVQVTAYGWGRHILNNYTDTLPSDELRSGIMKARQWREECRRRESSTADTTLSPRRLICLNPSKTNISLCTGDDGGPVVLTLDGRATVVGIVSHGVYPANTTGEVDGCDPRYLQGAVNVAYHLDWIESNLDVIPPRGGTNATSSKINLFLTRGWQLFTLLFG